MLDVVKITVRFGARLEKDETCRKNINNDPPKDKKIKIEQQQQHNEINKPFSSAKADASSKVTSR